MTFTKVCKICGTEFESESRNKTYCSDKCAKRGAKKSYRSRKMKHINAVRRGDDIEIDNLISNAYKLSREVAKLCLIKKCAFSDKEDHICDNELHVHHIDHDVFNNHPSNLIWVCEKAHNEIHAAEENNSMFDEIKAYITIRKQAEIRERNKLKQSDANKTKSIQ